MSLTSRLFQHKKTKRKFAPKCFMMPQCQILVSPLEAWNKHGVMSLHKLLVAWKYSLARQKPKARQKSHPCFLQTSQVLLKVEVRGLILQRFPPTLPLLSLPVSCLYMRTIAREGRPNSSHYTASKHFLNMFLLAVLLGFCQFNNHKSGQILNTGPFKINPSRQADQQISCSEIRFFLFLVDQSPSVNISSHNLFVMAGWGRPQCQGPTVSSAAYALGSLSHHPHGHNNTNPAEISARETDHFWEFF